MTKALCVAMWSGPRNISTAMMRAWENRGDTQVVDEPFYAHYLAHTNIDHPMAEAIIKSGETDWQRIVTRLVQKPSSGVFYQKHITTHMLAHISLEWLHELEHVFLVRDPHHVVASYAAKREHTTAADLGYEQQLAVFESVRKQCNKTPLVIDSARFLNNPESQLVTVCRSLGIPFDHAMLKWPAGERDTDGVWHAHWYAAVKQSTGFQAARITTQPLSDEQQAVVDECMPHYITLRAFAL